MRVTAEVQAATRRKILEVAQGLFESEGFEATTTRDIAQAAGVATGTLFNYFHSKEAILACLATNALAQARGEFEATDREGASFEEELFAFVAGGLRKLKPHRKHLPVVLGTALSPTPPNGEDQSHALRISHLETVAQLAKKHGFAELPLVALQTYWSLYAGLLLFWANDASPQQEDTLALLDHSLEMFLGWLNGQLADSSIKPPEI